MTKKSFNQGNRDDAFEDDDYQDRRSPKQIKEDRERKKMRNFTNNFKVRNVDQFYEDDEDE